MISLTAGSLHHCVAAIEPGHAHLVQHNSHLITFVTLNTFSHGMFKWSRIWLFFFFLCYRPATDKNIFPVSVLISVWFCLSCGEGRVLPVWLYLLPSFSLTLVTCSASPVVPRAWIKVAVSLRSLCVVCAASFWLQFPLPFPDAFCSIVVSHPKFLSYYIWVQVSHIENLISLWFVYCVYFPILFSVLDDLSFVGVV